MTALSLSRFPYFSWSVPKAGQRVAANDATRVDDAQRRKIVGDIIAAGACDSEYGVLMFMSVFPDQF
jgi:hypothetical protein